MVLFCVWEFVLSRLYANSMRGGNGDMLYVAFPSMFTVPSCVVNPMLQLGDAAKTVIMYGVIVENCCMPGQLIFTLAWPSSVEINVKMDMSGIWLFLVIAFLLKLVISHAVVMEPDTILSRQSDNTLLCFPSNPSQFSTFSWWFIPWKHEFHIGSSWPVDAMVCGESINQQGIFFKNSWNSEKTPPIW